MKIRTGMIPLNSLRHNRGDEESKNSNVFVGRAKEYLKDKRKAMKLIRRATIKAGKNKRRLRDVWSNLQLLLELAKAWSKGEYHQIPYRSMLSIFAAIVYFAVPTDAIPDVLLGFGLIDDAAVIGFTLKLVEKDLERFKQWKEKEQSPND
ncbi:YkvA family protein [Bacillus smithii]|uniref:YkvA family protein n=1 Tax=Bacillus smithii TaxID=1479 RepID=UPI003D20E1C1